MRRFVARHFVVGGLFALLIAMTPAVLMAQTTSLDPETQATVEALAKEAGRMAVPGLAATGSFDQVDAQPIPLPGEPKPEPEDDPLALPELNLNDLAVYSNQGVTIQVPADWNVYDDSTGETLFSIEVPDSDLILTLEVDPALDFPSLLGVALFRSQAEALIGEFGESAQLNESATVFTTQGMPAAKLVFTGEEGDQVFVGSLYVLAPNERAYLLIAGGTEEAWEYGAEAIELIAQSITFDEEEITVLSAGDEPVRFSDSDETVEVEVPAGWYAMDTGEQRFPILLAESEARYVAAIGTESAFGDEFDPELLEIAQDELDPAEYEEVISFMLETLDRSGNVILVDEDRSDVFPREGAVMIQLVGDADLGDGLTIPVVFYTDIDSTDVEVVALFGDIDLALEQEDAVHALVESVVGLE